MNKKPVTITAKIGTNRRNHRIFGWQFTTRKQAQRFAKIFLDRNPLCKTYTISDI